MHLSTPHKVHCVNVAGLQQTSNTQSEWVISHVIDGCFLIADTSSQPSSVTPERESRGGEVGRWEVGEGGFNHHLLSSPPPCPKPIHLCPCSPRPLENGTQSITLNQSSSSWWGKIMNSHPRQASCGLETSHSHVWPDGQRTIGTGMKMSWSSIIFEMDAAFYSTAELKNIENRSVSGDI